LDGLGFEIDRLRGPLDEQVLLPIIQNYDAVICGDDAYTAAVLNKGRAGRLRFISKYGVGLDKIDLDACKELGIPVSNCPGVNQISVAEHVLALLFTFEKNIHVQHNSTQSGSWRRWIGREVYGQTIGIIGLGAIGKELAKRALALGLKVLAFDLVKDEGFLNSHKEIVFIDQLDVIFQNADYISLHVPHTTSTEHLISREVIFQMLAKKPVIINTARGKLVDAEAIVDGLKQDKLRGYLTDVLATEPILEKELLRGVENIIITPHVGSRTYQSVEKQGTMAVQNLIRMANDA
jgi:D-3-phosphoglycerate dehydrogenase